MVTPLTDAELERVGGASPHCSTQRRSTLRSRSACSSGTRTRSTSDARRVPRPALPGRPRVGLAPGRSGLAGVERTTTTVVDAYLTPVLRRLADSARGGPGHTGFVGPVSIMKSNGGRMLAAATATRPSRRCSRASPAGSWPDATSPFAAGSNGTSSPSTWAARAPTSARARRQAAVRPRVRARVRASRSPRRRSTCSRSGPGAARSRGSTTAACCASGRGAPGPSQAPPATGSAGPRTTVTDANLVLGRIDPASFLDGRLPLDPGRGARGALAELRGARVGLDALAAAGAVIEVANEGMAGTIRRVAVERGADPRDFELVAFGGAGRSTPPRSRRRSGWTASSCRRTRASRRPSGRSRRPPVDRRSTHYARSDAVDVGCSPRLETMELEARTALAEEGFADEPAVARSLSMRYAGQNHELRRRRSRRGRSTSAGSPIRSPRSTRCTTRLRLQRPRRDGRARSMRAWPRSAHGAPRRGRPPEGELPSPRALREVCFAPAGVGRRSSGVRTCPGGCELPARRSSRSSTRRRSCSPGQSSRAPRRDPAARPARTPGPRREVDGVTVSVSATSS